jgi:hypothetical protein
MPISVKRFEQLTLGSLLLGVVVSALTFYEQTAVTPQEIVLIMQFVIFMLVGALIVFTSRKRSNIAKWIYIILFLAGTVIHIPNLAAMLSSGIAGLLSVIQIIMQGIGIYLLFEPASKVWFAKGVSQPTQAAQR